VASVPVIEYLFFNQELRPEQMKAEEILLGQIWTVVSPACAIVGLTLILWKRSDRTHL
jgi:hypothetical protein